MQSNHLNLQTTEDRLVLKARWIISPNTPPLENGILEIEDGIITDLHQRDVPEAVNLGNVALIPGLINAHTHLEFSNLKQPLQPKAPFADWIRAVIEQRSTREETAQSLLRTGEQELLRSGTTTAGDIITSENRLRSQHQSTTRLIAFREFIGLRQAQISEKIQEAEEYLTNEIFRSTGMVQAGLSPHAPYSVNQTLVHKLTQLAVKHQLPVAMHLAETQEELELLNLGRGPLKDMLQEFDIWESGLIPPSTTILDYLRLLAEAPQVLVVHGNYLKPEEIDYLAKHPQFATIFCPRTHAYFGHSPHPWLELLARGATVALGTDSRASNPDISLWNELCFLSRKFPKVTRAQLLELGTIAGARALGLNQITGSLQIGKAADLVVVSLPQKHFSDPYPLLFSTQTKLTATMLDGVWVYECTY